MLFLFVIDTNIGFFGPFRDTAVLGGALLNVKRNVKMYNKNQFSSEVAKVRH